MSDIDYTYVDEASIPATLKCGICSKPLVNPVRETSIINACCRSCISTEHFNEIDEPLVHDLLADIAVQCKLCEEMNIKRGNFGEHDKICLKKPVLCTASDFGCDWKGPRQRFGCHLSFCVHQSTVKELLLKNAALKRANQELTEQLKKRSSRNECYEGYEQFRERFKKINDSARFNTAFQKRIEHHNLQQTRINDSQERLLSFNNKRNLPRIQDDCVQNAIMERIKYCNQEENRFRSFKLLSQIWRKSNENNNNKILEPAIEKIIQKKTLEVDQHSNQTEVQNRLHSSLTPKAYTDQLSSARLTPWKKFSPISDQMNIEQHSSSVAATQCLRIISLDRIFTIAENHSPSVFVCSDSNQNVDHMSTINPHNSDSNPNSIKSSARMEGEMVSTL
jgi:hypothetical protein